MFFLGSLGRYALHKLASLGRSTLMFCHSVFTLPRAKTFPLFINQVYFIGVQSIIIILVSGLFIGMVLGLQGYNILKDFMATGSLGTLVALAIIRELGPVVAASSDSVTALLCSRYLRRQVRRCGLVRP